MDKYNPSGINIKEIPESEKGLPESFPIPKYKDMLFYLQRNLNKNTVIYALNRNCDGTVSESQPIKVFWANYVTGEMQKKLNLIQNKLAFGYNSWKINADTFKFQIVSYQILDFYLAKSESDEFRVFSKLDDEMCCINNIYVYAEQYGVFPQVKYIEFYGSTVENSFPKYYRLLV